MSCTVDEEEAAVHSVVHDVASVESALVHQVLLKLLVNVTDHRLKTETKELV